MASRSFKIRKTTNLRRKINLACRSKHLGVRAAYNFFASRREGHASFSYVKNFRILFGVLLSSVVPCGRKKTTSVCVCLLHFYRAIAKKFMHIMSSPKPYQYLIIMTLLTKKTIPECLRKHWTNVNISSYLCLRRQTTTV